ncbi:FIG01220214: hypothetical protein [Dickeya aquatica]|uniref:Uncharacterized protein n=1 Tax=Dickeya aquatica TaxID=1401087 RepID=A0A375A8P4_9GAMM|nr:FIG01220214: hypothetical protein [Dickeya aquatica]
MIIETATFSETELAQYCRKKGLYPEQVSQWKQGFLQVSSPNDKAALKQSQKEVKQLKRELVRKEKALAEAAAIRGFIWQASQPFTGYCVAMERCIAGDGNGQRRKSPRQRAGRQAGRMRCGHGTLHGFRQP